MAGLPGQGLDKPLLNHTLDPPPALRHREIPDLLQPLWGPQIEQAAIC